MSKLDELIPILDRHGYFRHYLALGEGNLRTWDWKLMASKLDGRAKLYWRFLLCGRPVAIAQLTEDCPMGVVERLLDLGLAVRKDATISLGKTVLIHCLGRPMFVDTRQPSLSRLGDDVVAVLCQSPSGKGREVLCLHSVGGTDALTFAGRKERRVTVVGGQDSRGFVEANWELNGGEKILRMPESLGGLKPGSEDLILARIPSLAVPEAYQGMEAVEAGGGPDGADRIGETFTLATKRLKTEGCLGFACLLAGGERGSQVVSKLRRIADDAGLVVEGEILSRQRLEPGVAIFNQAIYLVEKRTRRKVQPLIDEFMGYYEKQDFQFVYFVKGLARPSGNNVRKAHRILELTDRYYGTWAV